jgi:hypothetical protein
MVDEFPTIVRKSEIQTMKKDLEIIQNSPEKRDKFYALKILKNVLNKPGVPKEEMTPKERAFLKNQEKELSTKEEVIKEMNAEGEGINGVTIVEKSKGEEVVVPKPVIEKTGPTTPVSEEPKEEAKEEFKEEAPVVEETTEEEIKLKKQNLEDDLEEEARKRLKERAEKKTEEKEEKKEKEVEKDKKEFFERKKKEQELKFKELEAQKKKAQEKKEYFLKEIESFRKQNLTPLKTREDDIEKKKKELDKKEKATSTVTEEKKLEEARWKLEDERKEIEKQRWALEEQIKEKKKDVARMDLILQRASIEEEELKQKQAKVLKAEKAIGFKEKQESLAKELENISSKVKPLKSQSDQMFEQLTKVGKELSVNLIKEREIEREIKDMEVSEKQVVDPDEKRELEQKRWEKEEERRALEKKKWIQEREKKSLETEKNEIDKQYKELAEKESQLRKDLDKINEILGTPSILADTEEEISEKDQALKDELEKEIQKKLEESLTSNGKSEPTPVVEETEEEVVEEEPEGKTKIVEAPEEILAVAENANDDEVKKAEERAGVIKIEESTPEKIVEELNETIEEPAPVVEEAPTKEEEPSIKIEDSEEEPEIEIEESYIETPSVEDEEGPSIEIVEEDKPAETEEEARSVVDSIIQEAKERNPELQEELSTTPEVPKPLEEKKEEPIKNVFDLPSKEPSTPERGIKTPEEILAAGKNLEEKKLPLGRIILISVFVVVLGLIGVFWYWYFSVRQTEAPVVVEDPVVEEPIVIPQEITHAQDLIESYGNVETISFQAEGFPTETFMALVENREVSPDQFTRILIEDKVNNISWSIKELFNNYGVIVPEGFYDKINFAESNIFVYSAKNRNDFGFVVPVNVDPTNDVLAWESTLEGDMGGFYTTLGKKSASLETTFKSATVSGDTFRYISYTEPYLGACWGVKDSYLIFTTSGESIIKVFNKLKDYGQSI